MDREPFAHDRADGHARVERRERILEDDLHLAPQLAQRRARRATSTSLPSNSTLARRRLDEAEDRAARRRLAAARFADEAERLAGRDVERDAVHGAHRVRSRVRRRPCLIGKCFARSRTESSGARRRVAVDEAWRCVTAPRCDDERRVRMSRVARGSSAR